MIDDFIIVILVFQIANFVLHVIEYFDKEGDEDE